MAGRNAPFAGVRSLWRTAKLMKALSRSMAKLACRQNAGITIADVTFMCISWIPKPAAMLICLSCSGPSGTGGLSDIVSTLDTDKEGYTYPYRYASSVPGTVDIVNGNLESYFKITIFGPVTNPVWSLYKSGVRLETGRMNLTVPSGNKLVVDSNPATMEIAEYTAAGQFIANRYGDSDFTTARLFMLPAGNCSVVFTQDGVGTVNAFVEVKKRV